MRQLATKYFGAVPYAEQELFHFPQGLPAFEAETSFALLDVLEKRPLLFLQSAAQPELCFLAFPVLVVDPEYRLSVSLEDLQALGLAPGRQPRIGEEVLVLALLSLGEGPPTANLMAPIIVNLNTRAAVQAIRCDSSYSHQHPILGLAKGRAGSAPGPVLKGQPC